MQIRIRTLSIRLLVALVTFTTGVAVAMLWVVPRLQKLKTPSALVSETLKPAEISLPDNWTRLEVKDKVVLSLPQDMKPVGLIGDSFLYRRAYSNRDIHLTVAYDDLDQRSEGNLRERRVYSCDTPRYFLGRPGYHESIIDIGGRKAKLGIDRNQAPDSSTAQVCFPSADDRLIELLVAANCKDDRALETAQQIFRSIRFKDNR